LTLPNCNQRLKRQRSGAKRFSGFPSVSQVASKDEAQRIAANMAKLPELFADA
jgi:hypothetical protein